MTDFSDFAALERDGWGASRLADTYVDLFSPASDMAIPGLLAAVAGHHTVLDLCCGQGNVTAALGSAGHSVTGLDFSPAMLAHAETRAPGAILVEGNAEDLPFENASFDAAVSSFGLVHVPDQPRALAEIARVLRPGGIFAMTSWVGPPASPAFETLFAAKAAHGAEGVALPPGPDFHQFADPARAAALFREAGLSPAAHELLDCFWRFEDPGTLFEIFANGAPRAGYLLRRQPDDARSRIRKAMTETVRNDFADGDGWKVPIPAALAVARRP